MHLMVDYLDGAGLTPAAEAREELWCETLTLTVPVVLSALMIPFVNVTVIGSLAASSLVACNDPENVYGPEPRTLQLILVPVSPSLTLEPGSDSVGAG